MPWVLSAASPLAYIEGRRAVIERKVGAVIEPCLLAYGIGVNMGREDDVDVRGRTISGYGLDIYRVDADEGYIVRAIEMCLAFSIGVKPSKERVEPVLKIHVPEKGKGDDEGGEVEFESP